MTTLFQFIATRPPQRAAETETEPKIIRAYGKKGEETPLHKELRTKREQGRRGDMVELVLAFIGSSDFVRDLNALTTPLAALDGWLVGQADQPKRDLLIEQVKKLSGADPDQLVKKPAYQTERRRVTDSLLAVTVAPAQDPRLRGELLRAMYVVGLLERLAFKPSSGQASSKDRRDDNKRRRGDDDDGKPDRPETPSLELKTPADIRELLVNGIVALPADVFPLPAAERQLGPAGAPPQPSEDGDAARDGAPRDRRLRAALGAIQELRVALEAGTSDDVAMVAALPRPPADSIQGGEEDVEVSRNGESEQAERAWTLTPPAVESLSPATRAAIQEVAGSPTSVSVPNLVASLESRASELGALAAPARPASEVVPVGNALLEVGPRALTRNGREAAAVERLPSAGLARRPAVADLMIVREELERYEMGDVAHIENVLKGEAKERMHRRATSKEETLVVESEREEQTERDLQSTERFELQRETSDTIREDSHLEAGLTVTASYGPTVSATANVGYAANHSREQSTQASSSFAREVTARSVAKIRERVREQRTVRTTLEVEEVNKHGINNASGSSHSVGIYRWVDRVSKAQVFNYGRRLLLELIVPEPAAFIIHALAAGEVEGVTLTKPQPPMVCTGEGEGERPKPKPATGCYDKRNERPLRPSDIGVENYMIWVEQYQVANIKPPPKPYIRLALALEQPAMENREGGPNLAFYRARRELSVPDGYRAMSFVANVWASAWRSDVRLAVGSFAGTGSRTPGAPGGAAEPAVFKGRLSDVGGPEGVEGEMAVALQIRDVWGYSLALEVLCARTEETFAKWQLETYESITRAYFELKSQYDEQVSAAATRAGVAIQGRNPLQNRDIERSELKKGALSLLRGERFAFDAITSAPDQYPEIDLSAAENASATIQFFEQALEWPQMTYSLYPYFWGQRDRWLANAQIDDPDPTFAAFLKAGAARVVVPVRPGFDDVVLHYLATGEIWEGGQVPQVGDELYLSVVQELREKENGDEMGEPVGEPWEVRTPTSLVVLQQDSKLPNWGS